MLLFNPYKMEVKIKRDNLEMPVPVYANPGDAGMDVRANIENDIIIGPLERVLIPTGIRVGLPEGYEIQVRPRSGLALKHGVSVCNTPGTVDAGYTNTIGVILINLSNEPFTVHPNDRIAQIVLNKFETIEWKEVESLDETERGLNGFGSSGVK